MKSFLLLAGCSISLLAGAQMKEGTIIYERTAQLAARAFINNAEIAAQMPKSRTDQFEMLFSNNIALWQFLPNATNEDAGTYTAPGMVVRIASNANDVTYLDYSKGLRVDHREIMERAYIVTDSIKKLDWKLTDETKTILNYTAHKAIAKRIGQRPQVTMENGEMKRTMIADTSNVVAWYTTEIPVSVGPSDYAGQLPGAILEVDQNNGQTVIKALQVTPKVAVSKIKEPKDGKKLTAAEFLTERDKLMEEMRKNMPANGNVIRVN